MPKFIAYPGMSQYLHTYYLSHQPSSQLARTALLCTAPHCMRPNPMRSQLASTTPLPPYHYHTSTLPTNYQLNVNQLSTNCQLQGWSLEQKKGEFRKDQEIPYLMGREILHFSQLETEKNESKVLKSNSQLPKIWMQTTFFQFLQKFKLNFLTFK